MDTQETKKLKVVVKERKTSDGRKFNTYRTFTKNGRGVDLKFRKEVTNPPTKNCYIIVYASDINYNESGEYPVAWVKNIVEVLDFEQESAESQLKRVKEVF